MAIKTIIRIVIVLVGIAVILLGRWSFFNSGSYSAPPEGISVAEYSVPPAAPLTEFSADYEQGEGLVLIDWAHDNALAKEELNVLVLQLVSRGLTVKFLSAEDDLKTRLLGEEAEEEEFQEQEEEPLVEEEELQPADTFIVISPQLEFSGEERETVDEFVANGGKLLLIADPPRYGEINSLAIEFGLVFEADYLYDLKENEINYRNIFITEFEENDITKKLEKIALYTAGSISSAESGIAFTGQSTFSSVIETRDRLSPIALAGDSKVLAIYDLTFLTEPYNGVYDNGQLIANIADWLMPPAADAASK